jgi:hypothetical protein
MVFVEPLKVFELWNITSTVQRLPATVGEIDGELGVLDPPVVPVYWRCTPTCGALLQVPGLVHDEYGLVVRQVLQYVVRRLSRT